jgi:hypothetical protein
MWYNANIAITQLYHGDREQVTFRWNDGEVHFVEVHFVLDQHS